MGATVPESAGLYFSWGNTNGHPAGAGYNFDQATYEETPGAAINTDLTLDEDAARANLGSPWRMPTADEFQELVVNCTSEWTTLNGVNGRLFTSNVNGKTLFFPASGFNNGKELQSRGVSGYSWSASIHSASDAFLLYVNSTHANARNNNNRRRGFTIRAVQDGTPNRSIVPPTHEDEPKDEETATVEEPKDSNER